MRRFPDHRSMDGCELQLFSFPERDVVVPTLRDARQRTSEPSLSHCGPGVNFRPTEPLGSSLPHWATVKGVPNYRNAAVRGFMLSVAFSTHTVSERPMFVRVGLVVEAVHPLKVRSGLIDGEVVCCDERGLAIFSTLRRRRSEARAFLFAFDLLELDGLDMRREPIETRKATLASLLRNGKPGMRLNEHIA